MGIDAINQNFLHRLKETAANTDVETESTADTESATAANIVEQEAMLAKTATGVGLKFDSGSGASNSVDSADTAMTTTKHKSFLSKLFDAVKSFFSKLFGKNKDTKSTETNDTTTTAADAIAQSHATAKTDTPLDSAKKELDVLNKKLDGIYCAIPSDKAYTDDDKAKIADIKAQIAKLEASVAELTPKKEVDVQAQYQNKLSELDAAAKQNDVDLKDAQTKFVAQKNALESGASIAADLPAMKDAFDNQNAKLVEKAQIELKSQNLKQAKAKYDSAMTEYNTKKSYLTDQLDYVNKSKKNKMFSFSAYSDSYKTNLENQIAQVDAQIQEATTEFQEALA